MDLFFHPGIPLIMKNKIAIETIFLIENLYVKFITVRVNEWPISPLSTTIELRSNKVGCELGLGSSQNWGLSSNLRVYRPFADLVNGYGRSRF